MNTNSITQLSAQQLRQAAEVREKIDALQIELGRILGTSGTSASPVAAGGKRTFSPATRAKMAASQQARWAGKSGVAKTAKPAPAASEATGAKSKGRFSAAARAALSAKLKAYWAKRKSSNTAGGAAAKPKPIISAAGRARLAALTKARWAKIRAAGKKSL